MILVTNNEGTVGAPTTARMLAEGAHALDAIEAGIKLIEADPTVRTVGRGGWPNLLGEVELDSCLMDGTALRTGAVGALRGSCIRSASRGRSCAGCRTSCWLATALRASRGRSARRRRRT